MFIFKKYCHPHTLPSKCTLKDPLSLTDFDGDTKEQDILSEALILKPVILKES